MGRLVPLRLPIRVAQGTVLEPAVRPSTPPPSPTANSPPPPVPSKSPMRPKPTVIEMPPPLPKTQSEWRTLLDEVRSLYLKRQYKQCSARCIQVLEDAPEPLIPLHSIYLSFYAASCLELTARPLHVNSPQKIFLFELARFHYQKAEYHLADATIEDKPHGVQANHFHLASISSSNSMSSKRSSLDSSATSLFSRGYSSPMPSPTSSIYSFSSTSTCQNEIEDFLKPRPLLVKKKTHFKPTLPTVISVSDIDLGGRTAPTAPTTPKCHLSYAITLTSIRTALAPSPSVTSDSGVTTTRCRAGSDGSTASMDDLSLSLMKKIGPAEWNSAPTPTPSHFDDSKGDNGSVRSFLLSRSIARYNTHLESMSSQLHYHITVLEALIKEASLVRSSCAAISTVSPPSNNLPVESQTSDTSADFVPDRDCKRGNKPDIFDRLDRLGGDIGMVEYERAQQEEKKRLRMERMKQWLKRQRFDGRRWEELAEKALRELDC